MNSARRDTQGLQLIPVRLFFDQSRDERFFVLAEVMFPNCYGCVGQLSVLTFEHEDEFLERVGAADLPLAAVSLLAAAVIRCIDLESKQQGWLELHFTEEQIQDLGLEYASRLRAHNDDVHEIGGY